MEEEQPVGRPARRQQIDDRLAGIRLRLTELARQDHTGSSAAREHMMVAQQHVAHSLGAAARALAASLAAFLRAADAHDRVAALHAKSALSGSGDVTEHESQAAFHRSAAAADRQRARDAQADLTFAQTGHRPADVQEKGRPDRK